MSYFIQKGYELLNYVFIMMLGIVLQPIICMGLSITHFVWKMRNRRRFI